MISQIFPPSWFRLMRGLLDSPIARPLRFAGTGVAAGGLQLTLLAVLTARGWDTLPANVVAFLVAAQFNFLMSNVLTWRDRQLTGSIRRRWLLFHTSIAVMALVNMLVFVAVRGLVPALAASALGIAAGACGNYLAGDRLIFRQASTAALSSTPRSLTA
ncbi:MAG TPA: GtrA family protein [Chloroflexota bacterium]|jgi:putative flippase GtrA